MMRYWITKEIVATATKIGTALAKEYEQTLMQKLVESDVSISIIIIMPIRYNGPFVMMTAVLRITLYISFIPLALNSIQNDSNRDISLFHS